MAAIESSGRLTDTKLGNLVSGVFNNEVKANTLRVMRPGIGYDRYSIYKAFIDSQDHNPGWSIDDRTVFSYFRTLSRAELVFPSPSTPDAFEKSDDGAYYGDSLAGYGLIYSLDHPTTSLRKLFGEDDFFEGANKRDPNSPASPILRRDIFKKLLTVRLPINEHALEELLGEPHQRISTQLTVLGDNKVIQFDSSGLAKRYVKFGLNVDHPMQEPDVRVNKAMTKDIYKILLETPGKFFTIGEIIEELARRKLLPGTSIESHNGRVNRSLSQLTDQQYTSRERFSKQEHSEIQLTDEQRRNLNDVVVLLDMFQEADPTTIEHGLSLAQGLDTHTVSFLMRKARENSRAANQTPGKEGEANILCLLIFEPGITSVDIQKKLAEFFEKRISRDRVQQLLRSLRKKGSIAEKNPGGNVLQWQIKE